LQVVAAKAAAKAEPAVPAVKDGPITKVRHGRLWLRMVHDACAQSPTRRRGVGARRWLAYTTQSDAVVISRAGAGVKRESEMDTLRQRCRSMMRE
jgi:hypothetical protein